MHYAPEVDTHDPFEVFDPGGLGRRRKRCPGVVEIRLMPDPAPVIAATFPSKLFINTPLVNAAHSYIGPDGCIVRLQREYTNGAKGQVF
jgi:hypothetical protein